jgi:hypothetical protein
LARKEMGVSTGLTLREIRTTDLAHVAFGEEQELKLR